MSCMSQNFRLFHVSNLSVRNFRIFLLMYTGSLDIASTTAPEMPIHAPIQPVAKAIQSPNLAKQVISDRKTEESKLLLYWMSTRIQ